MPAKFITKKGVITMHPKQLSVFIENKKGHIAALAEAIKNKGIDVRAISVFDTNEFGILRLVVDDPERALTAVREVGYAAKISEVLAAEIADKPGALYEIFSLCDEADITIEYIYSFIMKSNVKPLIIMKVDRMDEAAEIFTAHGIRIVDAEEIYGK